MPRALVIGIGGQDGSHLADLLLEKGYDVHGLARRSSVDNLRRINSVRDRVRVHVGDLADPLSVHRTIAGVRPSEVYNEADQDHPGSSREVVAYSMDITAAAVGRTLESIRLIDPTIRYFQPLSATVFGDGPLICDEATRFAPDSPYAAGKCAAYYLCRYYRLHFNMPVSTAFLFSHDGPRRKPDYFLQRLCRWALDFKGGNHTPFELGNKDWVVDVGAATDTARAIYAINTYSRPDDWVVGTGVARTTEYWINLVAEVAELPSGHFLFNARYGPPGGTVADTTKLRREIDWTPAVSDRELIESILGGLK